MPKAKKLYRCNTCNMNFNNRKCHFEKHLQSGKHLKKCNLSLTLPTFECLLCTVMLSTKDSLPKAYKGQYTFVWFLPKNCQGEGGVKS